MLTPAQVAASVAEIQLDRMPESPVVDWAREFEEPDSDDMESDERRAIAAAMLEVALGNDGDLYCDVLALNIMCASPSPADIDPKVRAEYLRGAYSRFLDLGEKLDEPILELWLADAALDFGSDLKPAYDTELELMAWRLGMRLERPIPLALRVYFWKLVVHQPRSIPLGRYTAPARMCLASHLGSMAPRICELFVGQIQAQCWAEMALLDADQGRRQGVLLYADAATQVAGELMDRYGGVELDEDDLLGLSWNPDGLAGALGELADSLLLVGFADRALEMLGLAQQAEAYDGATDDIELLRRITARTSDRGASH